MRKIIKLMVACKMAFQLRVEFHQISHILAREKQDSETENSELLNLYHFFGTRDFPTHPQHTTEEPDFTANTVQS